MKFFGFQRPNLAYWYLLRVPIIVFLIFVAFPYLGKSPQGVGAYLQGMYDIGWKAALCTGAATFLVWLALTVTTNTIFRSAEPRFGVDGLKGRSIIEIDLKFLGIGKVWLATVLCASVYAAGALWFLSSLWWALNDDYGWRRFLVALGGFVLSLLGVGWARRQETAGWVKASVGYLLAWTRYTPQGFRAGGEEDGDLEDVHRFAFTLMAISLFLFALLGWCYPGNLFPYYIELSTLPCILLMLANSCWVLAGMTYLLDRWRIPLFVPVAAYSILTATFFGSSDHIFPVRHCDGVCQPSMTATQIMGAPESSPPPILVATSGGGILASAWTVRVLGELDHENEKFSSSIRLISSVSGGSVGAMHFVNRLRQGKLDQKELFADATESSLDDVAWALTYPDTFRTYPPYRWIFGQKQDRAQALRYAWTRRDPVHLAEDKATLAAWGANGRLPALVLNSTIVETGERFMFANYGWNSPSRPTAAVKEFFSEFGPQSDISINTAVANSAAFPYVSPAARADWPQSDKWYHLGDGGYFDNFGVSSTLDFLEDAKAVGPRPMLLVLIEATPAQVYVDQPQKDKGWSFQLLAPPTGLIGMWQVAARARNFAALEWVKRANPGLQVARFIYEAKDGDYPTSWHLTPKNQKSIWEGLYETDRNKKCLAAVQEFLAHPEVKPGRSCFEEEEKEGSK